MKTILIHGEDSLTSYKKFNDLKASVKKKGWTLINLNPKEELSQQLVSGNLFSEKIVYILDDFMKLKLQSFDNNSFLIIYSNHELTTLQLKVLPKDTKIEKYDLPKLIYNFLDSLYPGNAKKSLQLLNQLVEREAVELIFAILSRLVRDLYWVKADEAGLPYPDWRALKLLKQADKFSKEKLKLIINSLSKIDVKSKTSDSDLRTLLDFTLLTNLQ